METKVFKGYHGYEAATEFLLEGVATVAGGPGSEAQSVLRITTAKRTNGGELTTTASVVCRGKDGISFSCVLFQDFSKTVGRAKARCTEKNIREYHALAVASHAALEAEARAFYAAKGS
jgi:hypothetical protein